MDPSKPEEPTTSKTVVDDEELDALLDDALLDFEKPLPKPKPVPQPQPSSSTSAEMNQVWSEEFIREATAQFEKKMREYVQTTAGASASPTPTNLQKVIDSATSSVLGGANPNLQSSFNDALKGLPDLNDADLTKLLGNLNIEGDGDGEDMDQILPFMTQMMEKLLSKELLQPVMVDIVDRYPDWLADNRQTLPPADFEKYNHQYENMKRICEEYAKEKPEDSEDVKRKRFDLISELMVKVQYAGPPPKDLTGELGAPGEDGFPKIDPELASQCTIV